MLPNIAAWIQSLGFRGGGCDEETKYTGPQGTCRANWKIRNQDNRRACAILACTKSFRSVFPRNGYAGYCVVVCTDEEFQTSDCRGSSQSTEAMQKRIWKVSDRQNTRQLEDNSNDLSCAYLSNLEKMLSADQFSRMLPLQRTYFKSF